MTFGNRHLRPPPEAPGPCTANGPSTYRRRGIARSLIYTLICRAAEKGLSFLTLEVRAGNDEAIALYEKCGFQTVGRRKNYYEKPTEDAILMTRLMEKTDG